jgi:hypothetical protein
VGTADTGTLEGDAVGPVGAPVVGVKEGKAEGPVGRRLGIVLGALTEVTIFILPAPLLEEVLSLKHVFSGVLERTPLIAPSQFILFDQYTKLAFNLSDFDI